MPLFSSLLAQAPEPTGILAIIDKLARTPLSNVIIFVAICTALRVGLFFYMKGVPQHLRSGFFSAAKIFNEFLDAVIYAGVFVFLIIRPFVIQTFYIPSGSMLDTLQLQDYIIANKFVYRYTDPQHGDIVVFKPPKYALFPGQSETDFIKRCIGVPGDLIEVKDGKLWRNGQAVNEPYLKDPFASHDFKLVKYEGRYVPVSMKGDFANNDNTTSSEYLTNDLKLMKTYRELPAERIPPGYYLMMGDNRNGSFDGRAWGLIPRQAIIGRSEFIWLPISRWRITR